MTAGSCQLRPVEGEGRVGEDIPGTDDVTNAMLKTTGSCKLRPVEVEGRVGEDIRYLVLMKSLLLCW